MCSRPQYTDLTYMGGTGPCGPMTIIFSSIIKSYLLTYLFGHYNLLQVLASANLRCHTSRAVAPWHQFRIPSVLRFSSTCLAQRWVGRPCLRQQLPGSDSKTLRTGLELSIRATWPSHRRRCILIRFTTSLSSYTSYRSWFHRMRHSPLWETYINKSSFSKRGLFYSIAYLAQSNIY